MFPYTDKENEWLSTGKTRPNRTRKSNQNRHRKVREPEQPEQTEWQKVGHYWFVPYNRFKI